MLNTNSQQHLYAHIIASGEPWTSMGISLAKLRLDSPEHPSGVWKVMCSIPMTDADFFLRLPFHHFKQITSLGSFLDNTHRHYFYLLLMFFIAPVELKKFSTQTTSKTSTQCMLKAQTCCLLAGVLSKSSSRDKSFSSLSLKRKNDALTLLHIFFKFFFLLLAFHNTNIYDNKHYVEYLFLYRRVRNYLFIMCTMY